MRIVGLVVVIAGMLVAIGENLTAFVDPPSLIIVVTFTLGVLWLSGTSIPQMFRALFSRDASAEECAAAAAGWGVACKAAHAAGWIGVLIGAVIILKNLDDIGAIGPGLAICILTALYGLFVAYGLCMPCQRYLESRA